MGELINEFMEKEKIKQSITHLEDLLGNFREAKARGKQTNSNKERAQSISDIEEITRRLENYMRNNKQLLEMITETEIELASQIEWNDVIRPAHFEEDLEKEIKKLKKQVYF